MCKTAAQAESDRRLDHPYLLSQVFQRHWRIASTEEMYLLGASAGIVHGSTDPVILAAAEQLRDWFCFECVNLSSTHEVTRGLVSDPGPSGEDSDAFSIGRRFNVEPHEVDFRISGYASWYFTNQEIYLVRDIDLLDIGLLDIKPGSCPNSFNSLSKGRLPVALVGTAEFDIMEVDLLSVTISRADGIGGSVVPNEGPPGPHSTYEDVATPFEGELCDCHELEGDGYLDLAMKFNSSELTEALMLENFEHDALVELVVSGTLLDGTEFAASDCIRIVGKGFEDQSKHGGLRE